MQVELLIRSHDCFTLGCSVDGIAEVLKVSHDITDKLYQGKHYKLMVFIYLFVCLFVYLLFIQVRVLTGVGRFREMTYIIQLLLECDQFESLVHHGVDKVTETIRNQTLSITFLLRLSNYVLL